MATNTTSPSRPPAPPFAHLWQVPLFLLGALTLTSVLLARPFLHSTERMERQELAHLRKQLERPDANLDHVETRLHGFVGGNTINPKLVGEAHFLLGELHVRRAEQSSGANALSLWRLAQQHFEQAESAGVSEEDGPRMRYRLGQCGFHTEMPPQHVVELLNDSVESAPDRVEGYRLLTQAYLRLPKPDLEGALQANEKLRQVPLLGEDILGPARLQAGELLLQMGRAAEARRTLEKVGRTAAPEVLARARILRAQSLHREKNWEEAARVWQQILEDRVQPPTGERDICQYQLGYCYWRLEQFEEAASVWEECMLKGSGAPAMTAALRLGELHLQAGRDTAAVEAFGRGVRDLVEGKDWPTTFLELEAARALFEKAYQTLCDKGEYESAVELTRHYDHLADAGRGFFLRGECLELWATALAKPLEAGPAGQKTNERIVSLHRQAGEAYLQASDRTTDARERIERLWRSGRAHLYGQQPEPASLALEKFIPLTSDAHQLGEAWYLLGEARRLRQLLDPAEAAYLESIKYPTRYAYRARYQLSQIQLGRGNTGMAEETLEQNIKLLRLHPDNEALEKSLYALGALLYQRRHYSTVPFFLDDAVTRFPQSPQATRGRFQLAEAYRQLAAQENVNYVNSRGMAPQTREHHWKQHRHWLQKAAEQYQELSKSLSEGASASLQPEEVVHVQFSDAECRFNLGDYAAALQMYERLADQYKERVERLRALGGCLRCHAARNETDKVQQYVQGIRNALATVDPATRRAWETWLSDASKQYTLANGE